ncbi:hypothetical protein TRICI_001827 [Trichomonascus ciferrii]|uniref:Mannosyltransferase n=1 Tax=Trichomonascus ciferrii TaxID=44093 RepID=A0A642V7F1_9ASCO|nr:hypothetical protein TRICI_001827 [Trichomonascus ciferrii]
MQPSTWVVFSIALGIRLVCAKYSIIPDCDEVFNYWEPLHFLTHGFGLQTWEYSPEYAIRSWAYVALHAIPVKLAQWVVSEKHLLFYALRVVLAVFSAASETALYLSLKRTFSRRIATYYLFFSLTSTGMFHASVAFLPSSFAMHAFTMALSNFVLPNNNSSIVKGMLWTAVSGLLGWPFSLVLMVPFALNYFVSTVTSDVKGLMRSVIKVLLGTAAILLSIFVVDSVAYRKLALVPPNIVLYNVINSSEAAGPNIFGVEPWYYYVLNLVLNFNLAFPLAMISVIPACLYSPDRRALNSAVTPFYAWLAIFMYQPHKEERFMYVVYQSLCLNAAASLEFVFQLVRKFSSNSTLAKLVATGLLASSALVSFSRSSALTHFYSAPIEVFESLPETAAGNVCVGREWYRFPSSYFLGDHLRLKFVKSGFDGLLPGEFYEPNGLPDTRAWWNREGTWLIPKGMNSQNLEDPDKYVQLGQCDYIVDTALPVGPNEEQYTSMPDQWEKIHCSKFLDNENSSGIGRILNLPHSLHSPTKTNLQWTDYCILKRSSNV